MLKDESLTGLLAAHYTLLHERLHYFINGLPLPLRDDVFQAFKEPGKLFAMHNDTASTSFPGIWALVTLLVAQGISSDINLRLAGDVAIAIEIFMCGVDLLDDVEDGDQTTIVQKLGIARVLNVATALLMLAQRALLSLLEVTNNYNLILSLLNTLVSSSLNAASGQHLDLLAEGGMYQEINEEESIEIISLKSGSLMSAVMELGARCAGAEKEICDKFAECGRLFGIAYQLDNDSHDLYDLVHVVEKSTTESSSQKLIKTDLIREKKTFPIVIASTQKNKLQVNEDKEKVVREGIITSWGVSWLYRERALEYLQDLEMRKLVSPLLRIVLQV